MIDNLTTLSNKEFNQLTDDEKLMANEYQKVVSMSDKECYIALIECQSLIEQWIEQSNYKKDNGWFDVQEDTDHIQHYVNFLEILKVRFDTGMYKWQN